MAAARFCTVFVLNCLDQVGGIQLAKRAGQWALHLEQPQVPQRSNWLCNTPNCRLELDENGIAHSND